jgi:peroxiredoxin
MYAHERSLVKRLENKPFALLGINSDPRDVVKKAIKDENLTWRSWWDGGDTSGPIATKWNVSGWPTIYILDAKGVIRYKNARGEAMDKAVDALLEEMEAADEE